jgi:hypothetical protein
MTSSKAGQGWLTGMIGGGQTEICSKVISPKCALVLDDC